jgi:hypothetical protein
MPFSLEVLKAYQGDCFLLHFGSKDEPGLVLIDGGPDKVYHPSLKPRLRKIKEARGPAGEPSLSVDLLMVSHIDEDHIQGLLDLMKDEVKTIDDQQPPLLNVLDLWHNSFDEIIDHSSNDLTASMKNQFGEAAVSGGGELPEDKKLEVEEACSKHPEVVASSLKVLASIAQGFRLRLDAEKLGITRNMEFDGKLIQASQNGEAKDIAQGLKFTVVGPMAPELEELQQEHLKWLEDLKKHGKPIPQALAAYIDESVPNLSSIVVLAEFGGKCMLLTGDARGDKILQGLQLTGLLGPGPDSTINVDLLKVPHHGSSNNLDQDFFKRIIAKHYVFSGNGDYGNPERETMEMLWNARGDADYTVHLTYSIDEIDKGSQADWLEQQNKEKKAQKKNPNKSVRPDWSGEKQNLKDFFDGQKNFLNKVSVVEEGKPHVIDLLEDKVGF